MVTRKPPTVEETLTTYREQIAFWRQRAIRAEARELRYARRAGLEMLLRRAAEQLLLEATRDRQQATLAKWEIVGALEQRLDAAECAELGWPDTARSM